MDSPETVYIDGVPCNAACQSYMAWSRQTLERNSGSPRPVAAGRIGKTRMTSTAPKRLPQTRNPVPVPREAPRDLTAGLEYLVPAPEEHAASTQAAALETKPTSPDIQAPPQVKPAAPADVGDKTIEEQILAATVLADRVTAASMSAVDANKDVAENAAAAESAGTRDNDETPPRSPDRVVLILARADVKSIADLANRDIAIEPSQARFREQIRTGIVAAGASMVELRDGAASAIDRLVSGEQPAAILTLASPEAADWFPEIKGFRTFRIPPSPS